MNVQLQGSYQEAECIRLSLRYLGNHKGEGAAGFESKNTGKAVFETFSNLEEIWARNL